VKVLFNTIIWKMCKWLYNTKWAIFQLCHDISKLLFEEIIMMFDLY